MKQSARDTVDGSNFIGHVGCEKCGSSDGNAAYDDGHTYCFVCRSSATSEDGEGSVQFPAVSRALGLIENIEYSAIPKRGLHEATCKRWGYGFGIDKGGARVHVATYRDASGIAVAQKIRGANKTFAIRGNGKAMPLYGKWLWPAGSAKMIVVTEGELDALSVSQLTGLKWPVVSVPNGASGAAKACQTDLEYLESFSTVVFMFDNDAPGKTAAQECAALLAPGKAKIAVLPLKDANECLVAGRGEEVIQAQWRAVPYRPDGIIDSDSVMAKLAVTKGIRTMCSFPLEPLTVLTKGMRPGEIVTICSGSGMGKTEFTREIALHARDAGLKIGYVALEESVERTALGLVGMRMGRQIRMLESPLLESGFQEAWDSTVKDYFFFFDHFGSLDSDNLLAKLRYLRVGCGVDVIVLDHISIVVSNMETDDERLSIDRLMTRLRSLSEETGVVILLVSHLKQPTGRPLEEGGQTSLSLLRGSRSIGQLSDTVIGLERNQQDADGDRDTTTIRLLKCRWTGCTGIAGGMKYDHNSGRMTAISNFSPKVIKSRSERGHPFSIPHDSDY